MPKSQNPFDIPEWHAVRREASLVRHLIGSGVTALGRANYADQMGEYYTAFFGLSVGLERLAKLILVVDDAILNEGDMPEEGIVRKYGHELKNLIDAVETLSARHELELEYARPTCAINHAIIVCLDAFADAQRGRYANFGSLGDPNLSQEEPIRKWWDNVAEAILEEHYYGTPMQTRVEARARSVDSDISSISRGLHFNETGDMMQDVLSASIRTGQVDVVQRYGRYYTLITVRWLSEVLSDLCHAACYSHGIDAFFGVWECLQTYRVDDRFLKKRKVWPLR